MPGFLKTISLGVNSSPKHMYVIKATLVHIMNSNKVAK